MTTEIERLERRWEENPQGLTFAPLAEAYRKAGHIPKALELLDAGLAQHPGYVPAHVVRGRCHLDAGERALAELDFLCVVELDPENAIALQGLADLAESEGRLSDAIRRLESLLEVDRNNDEARAQLSRLQEETAVPLLSSPELRIRNDAETLQPSPEPLAGIEILDIEFHLPAALPSEPASEPAPHAAEPPVEAAAPEEAAADAEPAVPASPEPAPEADGTEPEPDQGLAPEPELVVTETMAEIFLRQGHRELALAVYLQLLQREPANERIASAVQELGPSGASAPAAPEPAETEPPRRYDAQGTGGRPVSEMLSVLLSASRPAAPGHAIHPPAFEPPAGGTSSGATASEPTFDEFFAAPAGGGSGPGLPEDVPENPRAEDAEDLEQFNAWLRGLQR